MKQVIGKTFEVIGYLGVAFCWAMPAGAVIATIYWWFN